MKNTNSLLSLVFKNATSLSTYKVLFEDEKNNQFLLNLRSAKAAKKLLLDLLYK